MTDRHRTPPNSEAAERAALGAMLLSRQATEVAVDILTPSDFYRPIFGVIYGAISDLYHAGDPIDPVTVMDYLEHQGAGEALRSSGGPALLIELQGDTPSTSSIARYAATIVDHASLRSLIAAAGEAMDLAYGLEPPDEVATFLSTRLGEVGASQVLEEPDNLWTIDAFLDRPIDQRPGWVIPGLARYGWRIMVVAAEGIGKTVLFRQIGIAAAQGIHPLHFQPIPPVRVLIVDAENPDDSITDVCTPIRDQVLRVTGDNYDADRAWLWHRPGGINVRNRRDRSELEAVILATRPELVCIGPLYKVYEVESSKENDEQAAREVMAVFDDLRTRYNFALMLEHHAPKGEGKTRNLMPYGSSLWLRWPEIGLKLEASGLNNDSMRVGRWRGDRLENSWPIEIVRGQPWMWQGVWPSGTFTTGTGSGSGSQPAPSQPAPSKPAPSVPEF